jgi:hypothetical protein
VYESKKKTRSDGMVLFGATIDGNRGWWRELAVYLTSSEKPRNETL